MHNMEECAMPTAKKTTAKSKATDSRVWIAEIPTSGDVGAYVNGGVQCNGQDLFHALNF